MLLTKMDNFMYGIGTCKSIAEIVYREDLAKLYTLVNTTVHEVTTFVRNSDPGLNGFEGITLYMDKVIGLSSFELSKFKEDFSRYVSTFDERYLPREYLSVPVVEIELKKNITRGLRERYRKRDLKLTDSAWSRIYNSLRNYITEKSCNFKYEPESGGLIGFLINATNSFYMRSLPEDVRSLFESRGLNQEIAGSDTSAIDYQKDAMELTTNLDNFEDIARAIYRVSEFVYVHNNEVYYDLFSRYKFRLVESTGEEIKKRIMHRFKKAGSRTKVTITDSNLKVSEGRSITSIDFATKKKKAKDQILSPLDKFILGEVGLDSLEGIIDEMLRLNRFIIHANKNGAEKMPIFNDGTYKSKDKLNTDEKLEAIFMAATALVKLLKFFKKAHINPLSVPSDVFKDSKLLRGRFPTFQRYMLLLEETKKLILEEESEEDQNLVSNDRVYLDIMDKSGSVFKGIPLVSIKDAIANLSKPRDESNDSSKEQVDKTRLAKARTTHELMLTYKNPEIFIGQVGLELSNHDVVKRYLLAKQFVRNSLEYWEATPPFPFENFMRLIYSEEVDPRREVSLLMGSVSGEVGPDKYLGYLRTVEFIKTFLKIIRDILHLLHTDSSGKEVKIYNRFNLFRVINANKDLFTLRPSPKSYEDFSHILEKYGMEYYMGKDTDRVVFNEHLVKLYNVMYKQFNEALTYCNELYVEVFDNYSNGSITEKIEKTNIKPLLREIGVSLYHSTPRLSEEPDNFKKYKSLCSVDPDTGFLTRGGDFSIIRANGMSYYVHESGNLVVIHGNSHSTQKIVEGDILG